LAALDAALAAAVGTKDAQAALRAERVTVLTNRATARLKAGNAAGSLEDCDAALAGEPLRVKALFRRAAVRATRAGRVAGRVPSPPTHPPRPLPSLLVRLPWIACCTVGVWADVGAWARRMLRLAHGGVVASPDRKGMLGRGWLWHHRSWTWPPWPPLRKREC
jgi:hypothetical protein